MTVSVVIRSKDEADRLRLTLTSLAQQSTSAEVVVVNDGSSDHTREVIAECAREMPLVAVHHERPRGRSGASNAGARAASGNVLLFLDGDTLADPDLVRCHAAAHVTEAKVIGRGELFHLRCTRFLLDPEAGTPRPEQAARLRTRSTAELERLRITRKQIVSQFESIAQRATPGIYSGAGPRLLEELEIDALRNQPDCSVLWATACGGNQSVPRDAFLQAGGFDEAIDINEHRELALRLCQAGLRMRFVEGAKSYHMLHRMGWRDPLLNTDWEIAFHAAHPIAAVRLLAVFWSSLSPGCTLPPEARILSIPALEAAASRGDDALYDLARAQLGLPQYLNELNEPKLVSTS